MWSHMLLSRHLYEARAIPGAFPGEADAVPGMFPDEEKELREVKSRVIVRT